MTSCVPDGSGIDGLLLLLRSMTVTANFNSVIFPGAMAHAIAYMYVLEEIMIQSSQGKERQTRTADDSISPESKFDKHN